MTDLARRIETLEVEIQRLRQNRRMDAGMESEIVNGLSERLRASEARSYDQEDTLYQIDVRFNANERKLSKYMDRQLWDDNTIAAKMKSATYDLRDFSERLTPIEVKFLDDAERKERG